MKRKKIQRKWLEILLVLGAVVVLITSFILNYRIRNFFLDFTESNYNQDVESIKNIVKNNDFKNDAYTREILKGFLNDSINNIKIFNDSGSLILDVNDNRHHMMMRKMNNSNYKKIEYNVIKNNKKYKILIEVISDFKDSKLNEKFMRILFINSLISGSLVLFFLVLASLYISKNMSKELIKTSIDAKKANKSVVNYKEYSKTQEIYKIQKNINKLSKNLKLKAKLRKKNLDSIIHQTNTPLTILRSNIEACIDGIDPLDKEKLNILMQQIDQLTMILSQLDEKMIEFSENISPKYGKINFNNLLKKIISGIELKFKQKNIDLNYRYFGDKEVYIDKFLIIQIIYNLLNNSYKYTESSGKVDIDINVENNIVINIKDTGVGIESKEINKIFQAYYRGKSFEDINGEGLGLFNVKRNINALDGEIKIDSQVNKGTNITLIIPRKTQKGEK